MIGLNPYDGIQVLTYLLQDFSYGIIAYVMVWMMKKIFRL